MTSKERQLKVEIDLKDYIAGIDHAKKLIIEFQDTVRRLSDCGIKVTYRFKVEPFLDRVKGLIQYRTIKQPSKKRKVNAKNK